MPTRCAAGYYRKKIYTAGGIAAFGFVTGGNNNGLPGCNLNGKHSDTEADCVDADTNLKFAYPYNSTCVGELSALLWPFS